MKFVDIDYYAMTGDSLLHKSKTGLKLIWVALLIFLVVAVNDYQYLLPVYMVMFSYIALSKLPKKMVFMLSIYPLLFVLFLIFSITNITLSFLILIFLKVLIASTAMILLFTTTSYKDLFSTLNNILPGFLVTTFFLLYRAIFILWTTVENIQQALYLRGGLSIKNPKRSLKVFGNALGFLVIRSIESSEKMYEGMYIRGHSNKIKYLKEK